MVFLKVSHGFRANYSAHTALKQIKTRWSRLYWFVTFEIEKAFDQKQCSVLINLLNKKIKDQKLINLTRKMLNCNIISPTRSCFKKSKGVIRTNILYPLLCNIYFHELDIFMKKLVIKYKKG